MKWLALMLSIFFLVYGCTRKSTDHECSLPTNLYFQNLSSSTKYVTVKMVSGLIYTDFINEISQPQQVNKILLSKQFEKNKDKQQIEFVQKGDKRIITLPPNSTTRIFETSNYYFDLFIDSISFDEKTYPAENLLNISESDNAHLIIKIE